MNIIPPLIALVFGAAIFSYALFALNKGRIVSTWLQTAYRPSLIYWVTVVLLTVFGTANIIAGVAGLIGYVKQ